MSADRAARSDEETSNPASGGADARCSLSTRNASAFREPSDERKTWLAEVYQAVVGTFRILKALSTNESAPILKWA